MVLLAHTQPLRTALLRPCASRAVRALGARACSSDAATAPAEAAAEPEQLRSTFLETMRWRGFLHQSTDLAALDDAMSGGRVVAYLGFDATASSLHVGSLLQIMLLRHFQRAGHKPIVLVGGGTTKDASRQLLDEEAIASNIEGISRVRFLTFGEGPTDALLVNNDAWLSPLSYLAFLRDYGRRSATRHPPLSPPLTTPLTSLHRCRHFTINRMLSFESVKQRLARESPLSFLEFNYMILQADGSSSSATATTIAATPPPPPLRSDQWGNIISGVELGRRADGAQLFGLTAPLADGKKMGKTAAGAVWLNEDLLSPYEYWQFWRNTADADACLAEIQATAASLFAAGGGGGGGGTASLKRVKLSADEAAAGVPVVDLFVSLELGKSKSEVRRLVAGGGAKLNDVKIEDAALLISTASFEAASEIKLSAGKKKHGVVELAQ
ncbi:mitochondrial tyrosyl-tRNA synthetase [Emiliania huxleyi CCMP1516]|uniref:tyrosine--tRNA ligase n=2 Tax=Emiliania huxleyi TaxID=2903 RepID=A0A0D3KPI3_EMIH1|nr:mitochondrial tyrosyl-tRNA synthetase [Emiliania huxleyi CCMP1516]EOD37668.1 mitochondrial tyrosyl-tRNA synthetase [Emiliania huxleyi CCMP1516]|eukprot:XP_005790097.1 mitochondrial tyrosyl-tRNA synthetase [Emiliania huxleyi CCMP1516]